MYNFTREKQIILNSCVQYKAHPWEFRLNTDETKGRLHRTHNLFAASARTLKEKRECLAASIGSILQR